MSGYEHLMRLFASVRFLFLFFFLNLHFDLRLQGVSRGCETDRRSINIIINNSIMMTVIIMVIIIAIINKISDRKHEPFSSRITNNAPVFEPAASYNKLNANKQVYTYMCMYDD